MDTKDLLRRVGELTIKFTAVATKLRDAANQMLDDGCLPDPGIEKELELCRMKYQSLYEEIRKRVQEEGLIQAHDHRNHKKSLSIIEDWIEQLANIDRQNQAMSKLCIQVAETAVKIKSIRHRENKTQKTLNECRDKADELLQRMIVISSAGAGPNIHEEIANRLTEFEALLRLITEYESMPDDECSALFNAVSQYYGQSLALSAIRGKLYLDTAASGSQNEVPEASDVPLVNEAPCILVPPTNAAIVQSEHVETEVIAAIAHIDEEEEAELGVSNDIERHEAETPEEQDVEVDKPAERSLPVTAEVPLLFPPDSGVPPDTTEQKTIIIETAPEHEAVRRDNDIPTDQPRETRIPYRIKQTDISLEMDAASIARNIRQESGLDRPAYLHVLVLQLLLEDRIDIAYHCARFIEENHHELQPRISDWLLKMILLGRAVCFQGGDIESSLRQVIGAYDDQACFIRDDQEWNNAMRLLLMAGSLRPSLLAPQTGARYILSELRFQDGLSLLYDFFKQIAELSDKLIPLDPNTLASFKTGAAWDDGLQRLQAEVKQWSTQSQKRTINFQAATEVWKSWMKEGQFVADALSIIIKNDVDRMDDAHNWLSLVSSQKEIDRKVKDTDRKDLRRQGRSEIEAKALVRIRSFVNEAASLLRRWIELHESKSSGAKSYRLDHAKLVRSLIQNHGTQVYQELKVFREKYRATSRTVTAASSIALIALNDLFQLFDPSYDGKDKEPAVRHVLNAPLLLLNGQLDDETWERKENYDEIFLDEMLELIISKDTSLETAFNRQEQKRDHEATARIILYLEETKAEETHLQQLRDRRSGHIQQCQKALMRLKDATISEIEKAVAFGLLQEQERDEFIRVTELIDQNMEDILVFGHYINKLKGIQDKLNDMRQREVELLRKRFEAENVTDSVSLRRINTVLDSGDVHTASEYIQLILEGKDLPETSEKRDVFTEFFPEQFKRIENYLEPPRGGRPLIWSTIIDGLESHAQQKTTISLGPIDLNRIRGNQARSAAEMLDKWFTLKRLGLKSISPDRVKSVLEAVGFNDVSCKPAKPGNKSLWIEITTRPIMEKSICPVPHYGSQARGKYRVLLLWDRPTEDELINEVGETAGKLPVIVFHFGRLYEKRRRDVAVLCKKEHRTFIVIDDVLITFLAGEQYPRLPAMFACTLPFTFIEPYTTTAGHVPEEVFFGRKREREQIMEATGDCFIFGGRQLGKTALLRDVERRFHDPVAGRIAIFLDLNTNGIGLDRPVDDIWRLIEDTMRNYGIITNTNKTNSIPRKIGDAIKYWLDDDKKRRILLMLDEADRFLAYDGKSDSGITETQGAFQRTAALKGWMDNTNRRFKVVFSGLHNVQRTTRLSNHPLAHYGTPICVGPLFNNGEMLEAKRLVEWPLESCGFRFEDPDLSMRILAQTNYYPSLIQIYCTHLLRHVNEFSNRVYTSDMTPPYPLRSLHLEAAYQSQDLRNAIKDRFLMTLQLDTRYEVIAYAIAAACLEDREHGISEGFTVKWITETVVSWWNEGFDVRRSDMPVESLIEEMVGLGILREISDPGRTPRFTLRSPNILLLLGTQDEIFSQLLKHRELEPPYEPVTFRPTYRGDETNIDQTRRSPLTTQQEQQLRETGNKVSIIIGTEMSGLSDVRLFLSGSFRHSFIDGGNYCDDKAFFNGLNRLKERDHEGTTILLVNFNCPVKSHWIVDSIHTLKGLSSKTKFARVVFVLNPKQYHDIVLSLPQDTISEIDFIGLCPWHESMLQFWLKECGIQTQPETRDRISKVTGNWPWLLYQFQSRAKDKPHNWLECLLDLEKDITNHDFSFEILSAFGIPSRSLEVFRTMAEFGDAVYPDDLVSLIEGYSSDEIDAILRWGLLVSLINHAPGGCLTLDPLLTRVISAQSARE